MRKLISIVAGATVGLASSLALADTALSDPDSLPKISCSDFKYSAAFLKQYPRAPAACIEGREANGVRYAKFNAKVYIRGKHFTTVQLLNVAGNTTSTFSFKAPPSAQILMNGKPEKLSSARVGDTITFWVPENHLEAQGLPSPTEEAWRVIPPPRVASSSDK